MRTIADVSWEDLRIGDWVIGAQGTPGQITRLVDDQKPGIPDPDYLKVGITFWGRDDAPLNPSYCLDKVIYLGQRR